MRGPHFCRNSFWFHWTRRLSEQLDHPFHSPIGQRLPLLDPLLEQLCVGGTLRRGVLDQRDAATLASATVAFDRSVTRPVRDAFVDCARRTQVNKGRVGATPREGTRISNLSNRGDLRNAGRLMVLLCFAPVKHADANDDANGRAYSHHIPLAKLKCISPRGWKDLAARRRGEEPGGALGVQSAPHAVRPRSLFRSGP